jgi:hypothetical protein
MVSWVPSHDPTTHQPDRRPPDHKGDQHPSTVASRWMWMVQGGYGGCGDRLCSSFIKRPGISFQHFLLFTGLQLFRHFQVK